MVALLCVVLPNPLSTFYINHIILNTKPKFMTAKSKIFYSVLILKKNLETRWIEDQLHNSRVIELSFSITKIISEVSGCLYNAHVKLMQGQMNKCLWGWQYEVFVVMSGQLTCALSTMHVFLRVWDSGF